MFGFFRNWKCRFLKRYTYLLSVPLSQIAQQSSANASCDVFPLCLQQFSRKTNQDHRGLSTKWFRYSINSTEIDALTYYLVFLFSKESIKSDHRVKSNTCAKMSSELIFWNWKILLISNILCMQESYKSIISLTRSCEISLPISIENEEAKQKEFNQYSEPSNVIGKLCCLA